MKLEMSRRLGWMMIVALAWGGVCAGAEATKEAPDLSSPKGAAKAFELAMQKGDVEAAKRCSLDEPGQREAAGALAQMSALVVRLEAASQKQFGTSLESTGNPRVSLRIPDPNGVNYATVVGDERFATVTWPGRKDDPTRVAKVGKEWRVDLTDEKRRTAEELKGVAAQIERLRKGIEELAGDIESGKVKSVQDARSAFLGAMVGAGVAEVKVEVKTTSSSK